MLQSQAACNKTLNEERIRTFVYKAYHFWLEGRFGWYCMCYICCVHCLWHCVLVSSPHSCSVGYIQETIDQMALMAFLSQMLYHSHLLWHDTCLIYDHCIEYHCPLFHPVLYDMQSCWIWSYGFPTPFISQLMNQKKSELFSRYKCYMYTKTIKRPIL
jgi:hypothetical protein